MSKSEEYNLMFYKKIIDGVKYNICVQKVPDGDENSVLTFLDCLSFFECESFIRDLEICINNNENIDEGFFSGSIEHIKITYDYPNINIDGILIISMQDMKALLLEWKDFINS